MKFSSATAVLSFFAREIGRQVMSVAAVAKASIQLAIQELRTVWQGVRPTLIEIIAAMVIGVMTNAFKATTEGTGA